MDIYIDLHVDRASAEHGKIAHRWFSRNMPSLFSGVREEGVPWFASVVADENGPSQRFEGDDNLNPFIEELRRSPYSAQLLFFSDEAERGRLSSLPAGVAPGYRMFSASLECGDTALANPGFCSRLVDSFVDAASGANPAFGRIEYGQFSERANMDIALRRKPRQFLPESRALLRGYAWVTICPEELVVRLGGCAALGSSGAFVRVVPLPSGGALLQATEALAGYSDDAMRRVFKSVAKVLPQGMPKPHVAFPGVRFVGEDARVASGDHEGR